MKIRQGFVSNSSTSSFVMLGFFVEETQFSKQSLQAQLKNTGIKVCDSDQYGPLEYDEELPIPEGKLLIGSTVTDIECCGTSVVPILETLNKLSETQKLLGVENLPIVAFHWLVNS
jgi:hypothetical protein